MASVPAAGSGVSAGQVTAMLREILAYIGGFKDVWFTTCGGLAAHVRDDPARFSYRARFYGAR